METMGGMDGLPFQRGEAHFQSCPPCACAVRIAGRLNERGIRASIAYGPDTLLHGGAAGPSQTNALATLDKGRERAVPLQRGRNLVVGGGLGARAGVAVGGGGLVRLRLGRV